MESGDLLHRARNVDVVPFTYTESISSEEKTVHILRASSTSSLYLLQSYPSKTLQTANLCQQCAATPVLLGPCMIYNLQIIQRDVDEVRR